MTHCLIVDDEPIAQKHIGKICKQNPRLGAGWAA